MVNCKYCRCRFAYENGVCHECEHHEHEDCVLQELDDGGTE